MTSKTVNRLDDIPAIAEYLKSIGAEARSLRTAVVKETSGKYWRDVATIRFDPKTGIVTAPEGYQPSEDQAKSIEIECRQYRWPELRKVAKWIRKDEPAELREAHSSRVFIFRDLQNNIAMKQLRGRDGTDDAKYIPYTLWDDGIIRKAEPDGKLPLYGLEQLHHHSVVFLHEGAKAARRMAEMVAGKTDEDATLLRNHAWSEELAHAAHLGWIGGAENPGRTDFSELQKTGVQRVFIVSDNDPVGVSAVPKIAREVRCPTYHVQFTKAFPVSFDLGDDFPETMFRYVNGVRHYIGDAFRECLHPATWATDLVTVDKKKVAVLRPHFARQWAYVEEVDTFVCVDQPDIIRPASIFNNMVRPFSHAAGTAALLLKDYSGRTVKLSYKPDSEPGLVTTEGTSSINVYRPSSIKPARGDVGPFMEYLSHLIPNAEERKQVERWCATLIARPGIRMEYGLLLMSETQGVGKNTLGAKILAPLVGLHNTSFPNEHDIVDSQFNGWLARKRLVFVGEVYSGQSWKAYNKLKSYITDTEVDVNEKHQRSYKIESWAHFCVCSNAILALKMEESDRRWLVPTIAETRWPKEKFKALYDWIASGGLSIILAWARDYGDYVATGDSAPMTARKKLAIEDSLSDEEQALKGLGQIAVEEGSAIAVSSKDALMAAKRNARGSLYLSAHQLGKAMVAGGMFKHEEKVKLRGGLHILFLSPAARDDIAKIDDPESRNERLRELEVLGREKVWKL